MAKSSGLGQRLLVAGYDLSGDIQALDAVHSMFATIDTTDITQSARDRIEGLLDGGLGATGYFDPDNAHPVLSLLPTSDMAVSYLLGTALGGPAACLIAKQVGYDPNRAADGSLTFKTQFQANKTGLEWGLQLTAGLRTDTTGVEGTAVDFGASAADGAQAYLHVTGLTGSDVTVTLEHSADNSSFSTLVAFDDQVAANTWERVTVAGTVDEYVRATSSGTFTSATFSVVLVVNP